MYEQGSWDVMVPAVQAQYEIEDHEASWSEFLSDYGVRDEYRGSDVFNWLGY